MATFTLTKEQARRPNSWALGQLLRQKSRGSGDPANEFSITTTADLDADGNFLGTYTLEIPVSLIGRATRAQVEAVLNNPNPAQPLIVRTRRDNLEDMLEDNSATLDDIKELLRLRGR